MTELLVASFGVCFLSLNVQRCNASVSKQRSSIGAKNGEDWLLVLLALAYVFYVLGCPTVQCFSFKTKKFERCQEWRRLKRLEEHEV